MTFFLNLQILMYFSCSIKTEPFKIPEDDGNDLMHTFFNPDKEGWLWKQGGRYKSWKRRWFILNDNCLYYFEFTTDKEPRGIIPLENIKVLFTVYRQEKLSLSIISRSEKLRTGASLTALSSSVREMR